MPLAVSLLLALVAIVPVVLMVRSKKRGDEQVLARLERLDARLTQLGVRANIIVDESPISLRARIPVVPAGSAELPGATALVAEARARITTLAPLKIVGTELRIALAAGSVERWSNEDEERYASDVALVVHALERRAKNALRPLTEKTPSKPYLRPVQLETSGARERPAPQPRA